MRRFTPDELKLFAKFVRSPYYNSNEHIVKLYDLLRKYAPHYTHPDLDRQRIFAYLFGKNTPYKDIKMRQFAHQLTQLIELFWATKQWQKQSIPAQLYLAEAFLQHDSAANFQTLLQQLSQTDHTAQTNSADYYRRQLHINELIHQAIENQQQRNREPNLQKISDFLDAYYFVNKLKYACKAFTFQRFKNQPYDLKLLSEVLAHIAQHDFNDHPAIQIYYHALRTFDTDATATEPHFNQLKQLLFAHHQAFNLAETQEMFTLVHNYCTHQLNLNNRLYLQVLYEVYVFEIEKQIWSPDRDMPAGLYRNMVTVAQYQQQYQWLEQFIEKFKHAVDEDTYLLNLARLWFEQAKFVAVITLLKDKSYDEALTMPAFKSLQLRTYYELYQADEDTHTELDYVDLLENGLNNFVALLRRRSKELTTHYLYYANFAKYLQQLLKLSYQPKNNRTELQNLVQTIEKTTEVADKSWIIAKIQYLLP